MVRECPVKAAEFDQTHKQGVRKSKNHAGAKELAGGYTQGKLCSLVSDLYYTILY